jgi:transposase
MRPHGSPEQLERRRLRAIDLLQQGHPPVEVAKKVGVDRRSVRRWNAVYRNKGAEGLRARVASGRPPKLDAGEKRQLEKELLKGAKSAGFPTDLWTCARIARLIRQHFGVSYHVNHVGRLLRSLDWSPQKPQRRAIERNEEEIQRWVKKQWPRIKKKPRA